MGEASGELLRELTQYLSIGAGLLTGVATTVALVFATANNAKSLIKAISGKSSLTDADEIKNNKDDKINIDSVPFEREQLANYYSVNLAQSKISFWFSLVFASIGFMVIVGAAFIYNDITGALFKITSGAIIDAVAALFFIQSRRAQEAMGVFFEKLRADRQLIEARTMCEELTDENIRDRIKGILVLHYSGLDTKPLIEILARDNDHPTNRVAAEAIS